MTNLKNTSIHQTSFPKPTQIAVNGISLEVFEAGQQNAGNPIVLCHGWPELAFSWRYQLPALVEAGYHVIAPNQRGFGNSSCPTELRAYDIAHLTGDLVALLDHYGYKEATFIGHDWGANVVWNLALLHPKRVRKLIALSVPYQERGAKSWIAWMEEVFGEDNLFVHFNRQPGVADAILEENTQQFLHNLFRKNVPLKAPEPGMVMINIAQATQALGEPVMPDHELAVFVAAFESSGFTSSINWYRNLDRNWHLLADVDPILQQPALMLYGKQDVIPRFERLEEFVPKATVASIDCGHWMQQEKPVETNRAILRWLE